MCTSAATQAGYKKAILSVSGLKPDPEALDSTSQVPGKSSVGCLARSQELSRELELLIDIYSKAKQAKEFVDSDASSEIRPWVPRVGYLLKRTHLLSTHCNDAPDLLTKMYNSLSEDEEGKKRRGVKGFTYNNTTSSHSKHVKVTSILQQIQHAATCISNLNATASISSTLDRVM